MKKYKAVLSTELIEGFDPEFKKMLRNSGIRIGNIEHIEGQESKVEYIGTKLALIGLIYYAFPGENMKQKIREMVEMN